ncbi:hypothetical protein EV195_1116 [Tenacibaculum skagerrakense]|uniref:Uncharacterized protein n=1 Tax=Tenacibaculum skagerrakense TaxID=186571 RepID=A0A4R2NMR3_9FLAO|nr:hypothetical protein EV195_1116 [Tenacibaculum skagerrakense]
MIFVNEKTELVYTQFFLLTQLDKLYLKKVNNDS